MNSINAEKYILGEGDISYNKDTTRIKIGDGKTPIINLPDLITVTEDELNFIKEEAGKLCGIVDNISYMFGENDEISNAIDMIETSIIKQINLILYRSSSHINLKAES